MTGWLALSLQSSQAVLVVKDLVANARDVWDTGSIPGLEGTPEGGNGNLLKYSCLENPMDREVWWATVHWVKELDTTEASWHTRLGLIVQVLMQYCFFIISDFTFTTRHIYTWASFPLWPSYCILSEAISNCLLVFSHSILDTFWF